jgi:hypothetical protein
MMSFAPAFLSIERTQIDYQIRARDITQRVATSVGFMRPS